MEAIDRRIRRLQQQLCPDEGQPQGIWVAVIYGQQFALDRDRCIDILRECGFLPKTRFAVLGFWGIPDGLNAVELEKYLRTNGAQICGTGQPQITPSAPIPADGTWPRHAQVSAGVLR
jgi:hypothetical protein